MEEADARRLWGRIDGIAGGWWQRRGREEFERLARDLMARGLTEDEAIGLLTRAYAAAAGEFGN